MQTRGDGRGGEKGHVGTWGQEGGAVWGQLFLPAKSKQPVGVRMGDPFLGGEGGGRRRGDGGHCSAEHLMTWSWENDATPKRRGWEGDAKVGPLSRCRGPCPHLCSPARPWRTPDSPAVEVKDAELQGGLSLHRSPGLRRGRRGMAGRRGSCGERVGVTALGGRRRARGRARVPQRRGRAEAKSGREERSGCSCAAHPQPQLAPKQGPTYPNHTGDPSIPRVGQGWDTRLKPLVCQRVLFRDGL